MLLYIYLLHHHIKVNFPNDIEQKKTFCYLPIDNSHNNNNNKKSSKLNDYYIEK